MTSKLTSESVLDFWFSEIDNDYWFKKDEQFDELITNGFKEIHGRAALGELFQWRDTIEGRLAEIIILDQFSRNIYRNSSLAFAFDGTALILAQESVATGEHLNLNAQEQSFLYMPYMHSESSLIHEQAVILFSQKGLEFSYDFELKHKAIIDRFGRYPHRNDILGRESTTEEIAFLKTPGSGF